MYCRAVGRGYVEEISKQIFVGSTSDAGDRLLLEKHDIESVFSFELVSVPSFIKAHFYMETADRQAARQDFLGNGFGFVYSQISLGRNVLIHCQEGISRSPSFTAGYLCLTQGISIQEAVSMVKSKRCVASPDPIFLASIDDFVRTRLDRIMGA